MDYTTSGLAPSGLDVTKLQEIYGTPEAFLQRYSEFHEKYIKLLETGKVNSAKVGRVNLDTLIAGGKIDLSILDEASMAMMKSEYTNDVLKLPRLFAEIGLPSQQLPSTNLYRKAAKYNVDTTNLNHGIITLLNRTIFNINPRVANMDAFNVGISNLMGVNTLEQTTNYEKLSRNLVGKKIYTFDVETTGVFEGSEVRSFAISENIDGNIRLLDDFNFTYNSRQLGGITVAGSQSLTDFFSNQSGKTIRDSRGGKEFLDNYARFMEKLMEADHVSGHNVLFDIQAMTNTAKQQAGFSEHKAAMEATEKFHKRMADREANFIIDTLEVSRVYMNRLVQEKIDELGETFLDASRKFDDAAHLKRFNELLYSPEFLARAKMGQSAATASVEAIAMRTNLLELIEKEAQQAGETGEKARQLFHKIYGGTHMADTDAMLQSYVQKYINIGLQEQKDPFALRIVDQKERSGYSSLVRGAQAKVFQSAALTPTTNIADVSHLSVAVRNIVKNKFIDEVQITSTLDDIIDEGLIAPEGHRMLFGDLRQSKGIISFDKKRGQSVFKVGEQTFQLDTDLTRTHLREIIDQSIDERFVETIDLPRPAGVTVGESVSINTRAGKILDLGINYREASQLDEVENIVRNLSSLSSQVGETVALDEKRLIASMGKTYDLLGGQTPFFKAVKGEAQFNPGLNNATARTALELAEAAIDIGSPHVKMSNYGRMFSTIVAQSTSGEIRSARERAIAASSDMSISESARAAASQDVDYFRYAKNKDLMSEYGVSHFKTGSKIDVFRAGVTPSEQIAERIFVPMQIVKEALGEDVLSKGDFSLSVARVSKKDQLNVFFHLAEQEGKSNSEVVAKNLYDYIMNDRSELLRGNKATQTALTQELATARQSLQAIINMGENGASEETIIKAIAEKIDDGGIGVAYAGEEETQRFVRSARSSRIEIDNDVHIRSLRAKYAKTSADESTLVLTGFENKNVTKGSRQLGGEAADDMVEAAKRIRDGVMGKISDAISGTSKSTQRILRMRQKRRMIGMQANEFIESLIQNKGGLKGIGIGMTAAAAGYYIYKRTRENDVYNETMDEQPIQQYAGRMSMDETRGVQPMNARRRDPLVTAGVVGNLDRNRINHHRMGNDKYNHLYSGV